MLTLNIGLPLQSNGAPGSGFPPIDTYIKQISDPTSPPSLARKYLTPSGFAAAYGPATSDYASLTSFAQSNGLTVARTYTARNLLTVTAPASTIEQTFFVTLNVYQRPDGSLFFAPANDPSVNFSIPILHVSGLDSFSTPRPMGGTSPTSCTQSPLGTAHEFFGTDFRNVYLAGCATPSLEGQGQTVALVEFDSYLPADLLGYALGNASAGNGVPLDAPGLPTTLSNITQELVPSSTRLGFDALTFFPISFAGLSEVDLDMQMVLAMAPQANIIVYEYGGMGFDTILAQIADDDTAQTISNSWAGPPSTPNLNLQGIFQQYAVQGQSFFNASGDGGSYPVPDPYATGFPASPLFTEPIFDSSLMTVVGGTELTTSGTNGALGIWSSETTWNDVGPNEDGFGRPGNSVTTGGFCTSLPTGGSPSTTILPIPDYQVGVNPANAELNAYPGARMFPDVSFVADNIASICGAGHGGCLPDSLPGVTEICSGGTSAASPLWAAFTALINQAAGARGPIGFANPTLYFLAASRGSYTLNFHDIHDGSNNNYFDDGQLVEGPRPLINDFVFGAAPPGASEAPGLYHAVFGYDLATGLGTPRCNLISALPPQSCSVGTSVSALVTSTDVTAYVPVGSWSEPVSGVKVVAIEGSGPNATIATGTGGTTGVINTCAGNSMTGTVVCTANTPDDNGNSIYVINGTTITSSLPSAGVAPGEAFSGGNCQTCNVVVDPLHNQAFVSVGTPSGTAALQTLNLATNPPSPGPTLLPTGQPTTSEDIVVDVVRGVVLSPSETGDYLLVNTTSGQAFDFNPAGSTEFDSAAEDCTTGIALSTAEFGGGTLFLTDISQASFIGPAGAPPTWSAPSRFLTIPEFAGFSAGLSAVAVDSSGSHLGVVAGEFGVIPGVPHPGGDQFGLIQLPAAPVNGSAPTLVDYVEAAIPATPDSNPWEMGGDPHTLTVYASPTNSGKPYAIFEDDAFGTGQRTFLAVVDLQALQTLPRVTGLGGTSPHVVASPLSTCTGPGPNPPGCTVRFVAVP
jgi:hypothetical protein